MSDRATLYAAGLVEIVRAEGNVNEVQAELFRFAKVVEGNDELRQALADPHLPAERRQQIAEDLLGGKASATTVGFISMVVATGRAKELPAIADAFNELVASQSARSVAEVRSAVELSEEQRTRLASALSAKLGRDVDVVVVVDPSVVGGLVTQVGDTVIDGSVRTRLAQLKEAF